jgi:uncharacterized protein (DUF2384 family)
MTGKNDPQDDSTVVTGALLNAANFLGFNLSQIAPVIGVSQPSMKNYSRGTAAIKQPKTLELALGFIRVYRALYAILDGDQAQMRHWMQTPNHHLRQQAPLELVASYAGLAEVNVYLDAIRGRL